MQKSSNLELKDDGTEHDGSLEKLWEVFFLFYKVAMPVHGYSIQTSAPWIDTSEGSVKPWSHFRRKLPG